MHHFCFLYALLATITDEQRYKALQFAVVGLSALVYCRIKRINTTAKNMNGNMTTTVFSICLRLDLHDKWPNSDYFLPSGTDWNCTMNESVGKECMKSNTVKSETRLIHIWEYSGYELDICWCICSLSRQIGPIIPGIVSQTLLNADHCYTHPGFDKGSHLSALPLKWTHSCCFTRPDNTLFSQRALSSSCHTWPVFHSTYAQ